MILALMSSSCFLMDQLCPELMLGDASALYPLATSSRRIQATEMIEGGAVTTPSETEALEWLF